MYEKKNIWLDTDEIRRKYPNLFNEDGFTASFIGLLYDANLLRGRYDRTKRQVFILDESFLDLLKHIKYNYIIQANYLPGDEIKFSIPPYFDIITKLTFDADRHWYTPTELLKSYQKLKEDRIFSESFIGQLVHKNIVRGRFDSTEKCTLILKPSFDELLKYRNYMIEQNKTTLDI